MSLKILLGLCSIEIGLNSIFPLISCASRYNIKLNYFLVIFKPLFFLNLYFGGSYNLMPKDTF